jgi:hypothetical protein
MAMGLVHALAGIDGTELDGVATGEMAIGESVLVSGRDGFGALRRVGVDAAVHGVAGDGLGSLVHRSNGFG